MWSRYTSQSNLVFTNYESSKINFAVSSIIFIIYELIRKMNWIDSTRCDDSLWQLWYITFPFLTLQRRATYFDSPRHWLTSLFTCSLNIFCSFFFSVLIWLRVICLVTIGCHNNLIWTKSSCNHHMTLCCMCNSLLYLYPWINQHDIFVSFFCFKIVS